MYKCVCMLLTLVMVKIFLAAGCHYGLKASVLNSSATHKSRSLRVENIWINGKSDYLNPPSLYLYSYKVHLMRHVLGIAYYVCYQEFHMIFHGQGSTGGIPC